MTRQRLGLATMAALATLLYVPAGQSRAGEDKVHTVGAGGLKVEGKVDKDDPKAAFKGEIAFPAKLHKVKLAGGKRYVITLDAENMKELDPLLIIHDKAGKVLAFNDDSDGTLNSKLAFDAPKDDTYHVYAAALFGAGNFTLKITAAGAAPPAGEPGKAQAVPAGGLKIDGKIKEDDAKVKILVDEKSLALPAKEHLVKLKADAKYTITMDSEDLDSVLVLQDKKGAQLALDDDSGGDLNSRLVVSVAKDDVYKVFAASLKGTGAYVLKITEAIGAAPTGDAKKVRAIEKDGLKIEGSLNADAKSIFYQVKMTEGKTYRIDLKSKDFDAYLLLQDADGKKLASDDDGGGGLNSRIIHKAEATGTFRIVASSLGMVGRGDFILEVREE